MRFVTLFAPDDGAGAGGGGAAGLNQEILRAIDDRINTAFSSLVKKDLPKLLESTMTGVLTKNAESIGDVVLARIQANLPSDDEIDQMQAGGQGGEYTGGDGDQDPYQGQYQLPPELLAELTDLRKNKSEFDDFRANYEQEREQWAMQAEEENRHATIQAALNKYPFANDESREVAFRYFDTASERDEETGALIAAGLPIQKYVEERMGSLSGLLASRSVGGACAIPPGRGGAIPQMEDIKPGLAPEKRAEIMQHAIANLPAGFRPGT